MNSPLEIAKAIVSEYEKASKTRKRPSITCYTIGDGVGEGFIAARKGREEVAIEAESATAAAFAAAQMVVGEKSGHLGEFTGVCKPRFPLRPLWLRCDRKMALSKEAAIHLPSFLVDRGKEEFFTFCRRLYELGFNAVILGAYGDMFVEELPKDHFEQIADLCELFHSLGIKVILKPDFLLPEGMVPTPFNKEYIRWLEQSFFRMAPLIEKSDGLFWSSAFTHKKFHHERSALSATQQELATAEARLIERLLQEKAPLIYYLPVESQAMAKRQEPWLLEFIDDLAEATLFSFSAVRGAPTHDHLSPHPLWQLLRQSPEVSAAAFLPLMNFGGVGIGEGLWPNIPFDLLEGFLANCRRHHFSGVVGLASQLPKAGSLLDGALWVAGQSLWSDRAPPHLLESWCRAYRTDVTSTHEFVVAMRKGREALVALSAVLAGDVPHFKAADYCLVGDQLIAQLNAFDRLCKAINRPTDGRVTISDYSTFFVKEAKRILMHFMQTYQIPSKELIAGDDRQKGFWTEFVSAKESSGDSLRILTCPNSGALGSPMEKIYQENHLLS